MEVGAALLSVTFELLLSKLNSSVMEWVKLPMIVRAEMQNWSSLLPKISVLLEDAEENPETNHVMKLWLADFRDLAYDMEDTLEEVEIDAKRSELIAKAKASTSKPQKLICPTLFNKVPRFMADRDREMASKVKDITARLQIIEANINKLGLVSSTMRTGNKIRKVDTERLPTTPSPEHHVYGRENEKEAILKMLLTDESKDEPYSVLPIVGMGGLGKTTLAQIVYNDEKLKGIFELKAWVCISEEFNVSRITRSILEQVTGQKCDLEDLSSLQGRLKEMFSGQKFLLVLDDIWNKKYDLWDKLQRPFLSGAFGSKIIITTRDEDIGKMMKGNDKVYNLELLENDACLSLFARHALGVENFDAYPNLKGVGEKIVEKCKRLPLAIKTLSGLLRGKPHLHEWEYILHSKIWDLPEDSSDILPALRLSYNHLPSHLKRCFGYCSIFPKDYEFDEVTLVLLWMAEGLLQQQPQRIKQIKDLGHQCFRNLLSRAFFQRSSRDESMFVMHDLIVDLALHVAGETCCTLELDGKISNLKNFGFYYLSDTLLQDLMKNLKCLRVLSLHNYWITKLSDQIGDLKHLRYINLCGTKIESLPESLGYLLYLQTLLLSRCREFSKLPATIGNLLDLQHLDMVMTPSLKEIPSEISNLTNLVTLSKFIVGNARGPRLKDLKNLSCLRGQLSILDLQNVLDANDAKEANLYEIEGLDDLSLEWCSDFHDNRKQGTEMQVLRWLKPNQGLKRLRINCFGGLEFPSWIGDPSFSNLEHLVLCNCKSTSLPSLGQLPQLKQLIITGMDALNIMKIEFDRDNSSLASTFPALESLDLQDCPRLVGKLPKCIPSLKKLNIVRCLELILSSVSLPSLEKLHIGECSDVVLRSMVDLTSLKTLSIKKISKLICLSKSFVESMIALEDIVIESCNELTCLWEEGVNILNLACLEEIIVRECPVLVLLTGKDQGLLPNNIQTLRIHNCEALDSLPGQIMMLPRLEVLYISGCPALRMFPGGRLPTMLKVLKIWECEKLESLPEEIFMNNGDASQGSHLEKLEIARCPCLESFPSSHLPNSFKRLYITNCDQLKSLPQRMLQSCTGLEKIRICGGDMKSLSFEDMHGPTSLWIFDCDSLESFSLSISNLQKLSISNCRILKSLPKKMHDLTSLDRLYISNCPGIKCISDGGLPPNLTRLEIYGCVGIESIPEAGLFPNLTDLVIDNCPGIASILDRGFPLNLESLIIDCKNMKKPIQEWGLNSLTFLLSLEMYWICPDPDVLPTSLTRLVVGKVENMKSIAKGLLQNLNSLQDLTIKDCPKLLSLPKGLLQNLNSLQHLTIEDCPKLRSLPKGLLQNLNSLQDLAIKDCTKLQSLPKGRLPPSLQELYIENCPDLQSLPKEGLPPLLKKLWIENCPLLERQCSEEKGDYWPLIARIPYIEVGPKAQDTEDLCISEA
ncbi:hypothetical protein SLEP1_g47536 [Rubroshorea leprosula]|uniref:Disease resistance RPP13-like protein 1 n=1 Tax=Rubroshorea leprosula TaxID=152421 RepID=A0AAV5LQS6_9ROSI|nr:hypothetical protein SLEP1_g47536 [Rubroshorea leprosula]